MAFAELFVEHTGRGGIAAALVEGDDFQDAHGAIERDGEHVADLDRMPGDFSRAPLTRTWPDSTSSAAEVRAFTTRACHSHLSMRCRSVVGSLLTP